MSDVDKTYKQNEYIAVIESSLRGCAVSMMRIHNINTAQNHGEENKFLQSVFQKDEQGEYLLHSCYDFSKRFCEVLSNSVQISEQNASASMQLAQLWQTCLQQMNISHSNLKHIMVSRGPGSFTGVKIAAAFAGGICASFMHTHQQAQHSSLTCSGMNSLDMIALYLYSEVHKNQHVSLAVALPQNNRSGFVSWLTSDFALLHTTKIISAPYDHQNINNIGFPDSVDHLYVVTLDQIQASQTLPISAKIVHYISHADVLHYVLKGARRCIMFGYHRSSLWQDTPLSPYYLRPHYADRRR